MVFSQKGEQMDTQAIVAALDTEIARLQQVKALLASAKGKVFNGVVKNDPFGRPKKSASVVSPKKRVVSAEAKEKMAEAQRARWAKVRRAAKKAAKAEAAA
jgi:hypothetical protein